jgi:hypothetical protein
MRWHTLHKSYYIPSALLVRHLIVAFCLSSTHLHVGSRKGGAVGLGVQLRQGGASVTGGHAGEVRGG